MRVALAPGPPGRKTGVTMTSKRRRHSAEQIIRKLQDAEKLQAQGQDVAAIARELGVTEATYYRWK